MRPTQLVYLSACCTSESASARAVQRLSPSSVALSPSSDRNFLGRHGDADPLGETTHLTLITHVATLKSDPRVVPMLLPCQSTTHTNLADVEEASFACGEQLPKASCRGPSRSAGSIKPFLLPPLRVCCRPVGLAGSYFDDMASEVYAAIHLGDLRPIR